MPFTFQPLSIPEVILVQPQVFTDERGFFQEAYKEFDFKQNGISFDFVQDNHSKSQAGVLRGLHCQLQPRAQGKLVRVVQGSVFDVAVDLRKDSPHYGRWVSAILSDKNHHMLWVPPGFAHGLYVLEDNTHLIYKVTDYYSPEHDRGVRWDDPDLAIQWPVQTPILSGKDASAPCLKEAGIAF